MKKITQTTAFLSPGDHGWTLYIGDESARKVSTIQEAMQEIPTHACIQIALPCHAVLIERHTFPATDRGELADMLQLQLEKTLPFSIEETAHAFEVITQKENESTVLSISAHHDQLEHICGTLKETGRLPERITLAALWRANSCPEGQTVLGLWLEEEQTVAALIEDRRLIWAESIPSTESAVVLDALPGFLLTAEVEGISVNFSGIFIGEGMEELALQAGRYFGKPTQPLPSLPPSKQGIDLLPPEWESAAKKRRRTEKLKKNLMAFAFVYLLLVAAGFIWVVWMKSHVRKKEREFEEMQPRYAGIERQITRWKTLAPAVEPVLSASEILHQLTGQWPKNESVNFTAFTMKIGKWTISGEGQTDAIFDFTQKIKKSAPGLTDHYTIEYPPNQPIKDGKFSFTISGTLQ